jgi:hypothetical protein
VEPCDCEYAIQTNYRCYGYPMYPQAPPPPPGMHTPTFIIHVRCSVPLATRIFCGRAMCMVLQMQEQGRGGKTNRDRPSVAWGYEMRKEHEFENGYGVKRGHGWNTKSGFEDNRHGQGMKLKPRWGKDVS